MGRHMFGLVESEVMARIYQWTEDEDERARRHNRGDSERYPHSNSCRSSFWAT